VSHPQQIKFPQSGRVLREPTTEDVLLQIKLRLRLDEVTEMEVPELRGSVRRPPTKRELSTLACQIYDSRRTRGRVFNLELFGEPAWDMLLALYCLPTRGELMTVTALTYAAEVPQSTGHRWQGTLRAEGLIERGRQEVDARKQIVRLTPKGRDLMDEYLTRIFYFETPVPPHPEAAGG
jgi:DNA-binding MarR family transcriptional regulator